MQLLQEHQATHSTAGPDLAAVVAPTLGIIVPNAKGNDQHKGDNSPEEAKEEVVAIIEVHVLEVENVDAGEEGGVQGEKEAGEGARGEEVVVAMVVCAVVSTVVASPTRPVWERECEEEHHQGSDVHRGLIGLAHGLQGGHVEGEDDQDV